MWVWELAEQLVVRVQAVGGGWTKFPVCWIFKFPVSWDSDSEVSENGSRWEVLRIILGLWNEENVFLKWVSCFLCSNILFFPCPYQPETPQFLHMGEIIDGVDMRAEVGILTRNIVIQGEVEESCYAENQCQFFDYDTFGGHVMVGKRIWLFLWNPGC